ncbi:hypothetical protein NGR_c13900 [Sinorhizobium fredii NGR234]|uniref:Uncharacterized protein n=1 Tax=Sinorhizobium fredii (strain NBRC 101917 / NGR234) TaxID=394 RepID=C3MBV8_SINFN|nr:hypothetical protein NGR_c13900 [Sinorhizobium fredii NGR234]
MPVIVLQASQAPSVARLVELVDTLGLGPSARAWGFESLTGHHRRRSGGVWPRRCSPLLRLGTATRPHMPIATTDLREMHIFHADIALHKSARPHYIQDIKRRRR